jgi:hypothetical protein
MPDGSEKAVLHHAVDQLAHAVDAMTRRYGRNKAVLRLIGDVDRLRLDASDCDGLAPTGVAAPTAIEVVPDTPYDESLWAGADDEGVGGVRTTGQR